MKPENIITEQIQRAQQSRSAADEFIQQYLPFIRSETVKTVKKDDRDYDDCLSIAMFAFHEALMAYNKSKGAFLPFAQVVIKNRIIDYKRKEAKHVSSISLDAPTSEEDDRTVTDKIDSGEDNVLLHHNAMEAKREIEEFAITLAEFGLELSDIAENCPKQKRTLNACHKILSCAIENKDLLSYLETTKKLPVQQIIVLSGVNRKVIERHRKYLVALLLAYTNGFEIIRAHLKQSISKKGGKEQ